jgi:hypothetical protein
VHHTIRVSIRDPRDLFAAPEMDALAGQFANQSGIDQLIDQLEELRPRATGGTIEVALPADRMQPHLEDEIKAAIAGFCVARIADEKHELRMIQRHGRQALWIGLPILGVCLALSTASLTAFGSTGLGNLLSNGLIIAGWVAMWRPAELLLYDWWPYRMRIGQLETLPRMAVKLVAV